MLYVINYANSRFRNAQKLNSKTARKYGKADIVVEYSEKDIDKDFYNKNIKILSQKRGNGYWLWKSYIINKTLKKMNDGDYLMYCDSGAYFVNDIHTLIDEMKKEKQDIMCFEIDTIEKHYSKRDALILMECDKPIFYETNQIEAGLCIFRKCKNTTNFVEEWLSYAQDERIITNNPNECGKENYEGFVENRHDQTVFSLLCKKNNIIPHRDIAQYGNNKKMENSPYPQIVELHRYGFARTILGVKIYRIILPILMPIYKKIFR